MGVFRPEPCVTLYGTYRRIRWSTPVICSGERKMTRSEREFQMVMLCCEEICREI
jgi:hypothetical protein